MLAQAAALIVNVAANLVLLPRYGVLGAAMASAVGYAVSAALISLGFARRFGIPLAQLMRPESPWSLWQKLRQA
jgi:Na+-driven multidrug efflux pump